VAGEGFLGVNLRGAGDISEVGEDISAAKEVFWGVTKDIFEAGEDMMEAADFLEEGDNHSAGEGIDISVGEDEDKGISVGEDKGISE